MLQHHHRASLPWLSLVRWVGQESRVKSPRGGFTHIYIFCLEFQPITFTLNDNSLSSNQNTNQFLV